MKFIKIGGTIVNVAVIKTIYIHNKSLIITCTDQYQHEIVYDNEMEVWEALNRIYKQLE